MSCHSLQQRQQRVTIRQAKRLLQTNPTPLKPQYIRISPMLHPKLDPIDQLFADGYGVFQVSCKAVLHPKEYPAIIA